MIVQLTTGCGTDGSFYSTNYFIELLATLLTFTYLQVLSACSPYFRQLFMASPAQHQTVFIKVRLEQSGHRKNFVLP